jgi:tetratricopeptide (TPR) repeat protein
MTFVIVCIGMIVALGLVALVANYFDKGEDTIVEGHDCSTCTEAEHGDCKIHCLMEEAKKKKKKDRQMATLLIVLFSLVLSGCSTKKNTASTRWWHSFNARYNTYFNGNQAFIDGNLEKEKGNKDNYTEIIPLYMVGNKQSREIGKGQYDRAIEKSEKAIRRHSIKAKPEWNSSKRKTAKDREWLGRREYNPFLWRAWMLLGKSQFQKGAFDEAAATFTYMSRLYHTQPMQSGLAKAWLAKSYTELGWMYDAEDVIRNMSRDSMDFRAVKDWDYTYANYYIHSGDYQKAIPYLRKAISHERRKVQRAREWFLMGQIQNQLGNKDEAYKAYRKVVACNPPYELEFNARIAQTEVMADRNGKQMISKLKRMAVNDNNAEYLDQVYYAIGNIYMLQKDTAQAIAAYEKGNQKSVRNGIEKGVLLLTLGNIYWQIE